jgi:dnd system-associated protein 4
MPRRIEYAKEHEGLINELVRSDNTTGPFENKARCITYAAAYGSSYGPVEGRKSLPEKKSDRAEPIRYDVFQESRFDDFISALGIFATGDMNLLEPSEEAADKRIAVFEEFANLGLEKLKRELNGEINLTEGLMLILSKQHAENVNGGEIDWEKIASL